MCEKESQAYLFLGGKLTGKQKQRLAHLNRSAKIIYYVDKKITRECRSVCAPSAGGSALSAPYESSMSGLEKVK